MKSEASYFGPGSTISIVICSNWSVAESVCDACLLVVDDVDCLPIWRKNFSIDPPFFCCASSEYFSFIFAIIEVTISFRFLAFFSSFSAFDFDDDEERSADAKPDDDWQNELSKIFISTFINK